MSKPDLTQESVLEAVHRFQVEHGKPPNAASGDATHYFGHAETWAAVNLALTHGRRGLSGKSSLSKLIKGNQQMSTNTSTNTLRSIDGGLSQDPEEVQLLAELASLPGTAHWSEMTRIETELRESFEYQWMPLEGPRNNLTVLNMVTDPLAALKEAPTNSGEAVNDKKFHALQKPKGKMGPIELSEECGFTEDFLNGAHPSADKAKWASAKKQAEKISVSFFDGEHGYINYEVYDDGIGITPENAATSILEIAGANKTNKETNRRHVGKNGVGGISSLRFVGNTGGSRFLSYATHTYDFDGTKSKKRKVKNPMVWVTVVKIVTLEHGIPVLCRLVDKNGEIPVVSPDLVTEPIQGSLLENMASAVGADVLKRVKNKEENQETKGKLGERVATVLDAGGVDWTTRPITPGTRVCHFNYNLAGFNRADISKNIMRRIMHTYFPRALHPFTYYDYRQLHFFNANWKAQRIRAVTGLRYYLENSPSVVLGKNGTGFLPVIEFDNEWGQRERVQANVWVLKRANETLGGVEATRENYEAEDRVRKSLDLKDGDSLPTSRLEELRDSYKAKGVKLTAKGKSLTKKDTEFLNDLENILKGRKNSGKPPVESQTLKNKTMLYSLSGITHDAGPSSRFWQDCKMAALDTRAIIEIRLDGLSDLTQAHIIDSKREGLVAHTKTCKNMYKALVNAVKAHQGLKDLYQEIRDLSDSQLGETDEDLIKSVNKIVELIEADKRLVITRQKEKPFPLGQSDTLRKIKVMAGKQDKVWLKPKRRSTILIAGDAPDGFLLDFASTEVEIEGGSTRLTGHTPFHNGYATVTCEWDGPDREESGELRVRTKNPITGFTITSKPVTFEVVKENTNDSGKKKKKGKLGEQAPQITPRPITRSEWGAPTTGPFDEDSIASIVDDGDNKYTVYVNVDNVVFAQQMDSRNYSSAHRETLRRDFTTWMAAFLYGLEYGALGYSKRQAEDGYSNTIRTDKDQHADYRHAMGMFMGLRFRRDPVAAE
jgi:hypothetical protein